MKKPNNNDDIVFRNILLNNQLNKKKSFFLRGRFPLELYIITQWSWLLCIRIIVGDAGFEPGISQLKNGYSGFFPLVQATWPSIWNQQSSVARQPGPEISPSGLNDRGENRTEIPPGQRHPEGIYTLYTRPLDIQTIHLFMVTVHSCDVENFFP